MGKIICFMGKSSTGKDTIFRKLIENGEPQLSTLVPYTTRPIRDGEKDGVKR
jgi:guanylate kinase